MATLGQVIKSARKRKGLTLGQLGDLVGRSASYLQKLESDRYETPSSSSLRAIARELGLDPLDLAALVWGQPEDREATPQSEHPLSASKSSEADLDPWAHIRGDSPVLPAIGAAFLQGRPDTQSINLALKLIEETNVQERIALELFWWTGDDISERRSYGEALAIFKSIDQTLRSVEGLFQQLLHVPSNQLSLIEPPVEQLLANTAAARMRAAYRIGRILQELAYVSFHRDGSMSQEVHGQGYLLEALHWVSEGLFLRGRESFAELGLAETGDRECYGVALGGLEAMLFDRLSEGLPLGHPTKLGTSIPVHQVSASSADLDIVARSRFEHALDQFTNLVEKLEREVSGASSNFSQSERLADAYHRLAFLIRARVNEQDAERIFANARASLIKAIRIRGEVWAAARALSTSLTSPFLATEQRRFMARYHREYGYLIWQYISRLQVAKGAVDKPRAISLGAELMWQYETSSHLDALLKPRNLQRIQTALRANFFRGDEVQASVKQIVDRERTSADFDSGEYKLSLLEDR